METISRSLHFIFTDFITFYAKRGILKACVLTQVVSGGRIRSLDACSGVVPLPLTVAVCVCCVKVATHPHPHGSDEKATPDRPTKHHGVSVSSAVFRHATLFSALILLSGNGDTSDRCEDSDIFTRLCWINTTRLEGSVSCVQQTHTGGDNVITPCVFLQVQVVQR